MISSARIHPYLALLCCRDDFFCSDASPACFFVLQGLFLLLRCIPSLLFVPQGLFLPLRCISILLFFTTGIISAARIHPYLALFFRRDYFRRPDSSLSCSFLPQGLFPPPGFIPSLLFCTAGIISSARMHLYLALLFHRDYFARPDASLSCSFSLQGLLLPLRCIPSLLFSSAGIISSARIHLYLAFLCCRDYFFCSDASPACSFVPQGLFLPLRCISILLFFTTGIISAARIHPYLALFLRRDDFFCSDASPACSFPPQGLLRPPGFIPSLLFSPQGLFLPPGFIPILLFFSTGIISDCDDPP